MKIIHAHSHHDKLCHGCKSEIFPHGEIGWQSAVGRESIGCVGGAIWRLTFSKALKMFHHKLQAYFNTKNC